MLLASTEQADVNWLLSTAVQSGAALVAIIGGLLVARLVGLSTERDGLRRRLREARIVLEQRADELDRAEKALDEMTADQLMQAGFNQILVSHGSVSAAELSAACNLYPGPHGLDTIVVPVLEQFARVFKTLSKQIDGFDPNGAHFAEFVERLPEEDRAAGRLALTQLRSEVPSPFAARNRTLALMSRSVDPNEAATRARRFDEARAVIHAADTQVRRSKVEEANASAALLAVNRPLGIRRSLFVLAYLTLVCIVAPLALMAWGRMFLPAAVRALAVVTFSSGLAVFLWMLRSMTRPDPDLASDVDKTLNG